MGACYKCGGEGYLSKMTVLGKPPQQVVPVKNGNTHSLGRQFQHTARQKLCPVCGGDGRLRGVQTMRA